MAQMIQYGSELLRIDTQKNTIEYSKDGGRSWRSRYMGSIAGVFVDLLVYGSEILACTSKGIYYSKDGGYNWRNRYNSNSCGSFLQLASDGQNVLATTSKGLYYSKDGGNNWRRR